jgi:WD40 repeat protein
VTLMDEDTSEVRWDVLAHTTDLYMAPQVALSPNGAFVASVLRSVGLKWKLWDVESGLLDIVGTAHDGTGACICGVPDLDDPPVVQQGCPVVAHTRPIMVLIFSPCGQRLATAGQDRVVIIWDARTGEAEFVLHGHTDRVNSISFSADGVLLASGGQDRSIHVWDTITGALLRTIPNAHHPVMWLNFSPTDSRSLASVGYNPALVQQWDVESGEMSSSFNGLRFAVFSPDGRIIATAGPAGSYDVDLVDSTTGMLRLRLDGNHHRVYSVSWSVDGSKLASASWNGPCNVWDSSTGALLKTIDVGDPATSISWGCDWVLDNQRAMALAFTMGHHPRLGAASRLLGLDEELVHMILDLLKPMQK